MNTVDKTIDNVIDALGDFIEVFTGEDTVVRGEVNRVSPPLPPYVVLTELFTSDLEIPITNYFPSKIEDEEETPSAAKIKGPTKITVQADFYGEAAGDYCKAVKQAIRSLWGFDHFSSNIKPLYCDDGKQAPFTTGEQQYERRWILTVALQYNPIVTVSQDFADTAATNGIIAADVIYSP